LGGVWGGVLGGDRGVTNTLWNRHPQHHLQHIINLLKPTNRITPTQNKPTHPSTNQPTHPPKAVVDIATLTGACMIALGGEVAGLFTPSDKMAAGVTSAAKAAGEKVWRMPMEANYFEQLKSSCADMRNTGGR